MTDFGIGKVNKKVNLRQNKTQNYTHKNKLKNKLTKQPSSFGSTGCLKGRDSGSCLYKFSKVGTSACRNSSGRKTMTQSQHAKIISKLKKNPELQLTYYIIVLTLNFF